MAFGLSNTIGLAPINSGPGLMSPLQMAQTGYYQGINASNQYQLEQQKSKDADNQAFLDMLAKHNKSGDGGEAQPQQSPVPPPQEGPVVPAVQGLGQVYGGVTVPSQGGPQVQAQNPQLNPNPNPTYGSVTVPSQAQGLGSLNSPAPQPQQGSPTKAPQIAGIPFPQTETSAADHPVVQKANQMPNLADTSGASDGDYSATHVFTATDPQTGQETTNTFDRAGLVRDMMAYTDKNGHHTLAQSANALQQQWVDSDLASQTAKQAKVVSDHAQIAGQLAAFDSLPESMKPQAYQAEMGKLRSEGIDPQAAGLPVQYDGSPQTKAAISNFAEQAKTVAEREKAKYDALTNKVQQQNADSTTAERAEQQRHDKAEEWLKAQELAQKAKQGNMGDPSNLVGPSYLNTLPPDVQNYLRGVATGNVPINTRSNSAALKAANQAFPDVNIAGAQKFTQELGKVSAGTSGGVAVGANKTMEHIGVMADADSGGAQLDFGPNWLDAAYNATVNKVKGSNAEKVWNTAHAATMTEMARSFKGGPPAESEIVRDMKNLSYSDSPTRKMQVYKAYSDLLQGQTGGVEADRRMNYGSADPGTSLLTVKSQNMVKRLNGGKLPDGMLPSFESKVGQTPATGQAPQGPSFSGRTMPASDFANFNQQQQIAFIQGGGKVQ